MEEALRFRVVAWWASGRTGIAKSSSSPNAIHFSSPPALGGIEDRWTPSDLLLCAIASCYTTTFRAVAEHSRFEYTDLQVEVEGGISRNETGYNFGDVMIRANLTVPQGADQARALKLLHRAEGLCLVSRALSVEKRFEPRVEVGETRVEVVHSLSATAKGDDHRPNQKAQ